jgi:hypothetical protein
VVVPAEAIQLLSRGDLRWRIANRLGGSEEWAWRSTASDGTLNSAVLPDLVIGGLNEQRGLWAYFSDGPAAGQERRVIAFTPYDPGDPTAAPPIPEALPEIVWSPPLTDPVTAGDRVWLSVLRPTRINDAIDDALRLLAEPISLPMQTEIVTDGTTDTFVLPEACIGVADVFWLDEPGLIVEGTAVEPWRDLLPRSSWEMVPGRSIRLGGVNSLGPLGWHITPPPAGWRMLISYRAAVPLPTSDDDLVQCLPGAIVSSATADLAMGQPELRTMLPLMIDQAQRDRARAARHDHGSIRPIMP